MSCFSYHSSEQFQFPFPFVHHVNNILPTSNGDVTPILPKRSDIEYKVLSKLNISSELELKSSNNTGSSITRMDIDKHENRWLLTGNNAGVVSLYDLNSVHFIFNSF